LYSNDIQIIIAVHDIYGKFQFISKREICIAMIFKSSLPYMIYTEIFSLSVNCKKAIFGMLFAGQKVAIKCPRGLGLIFDFLELDPVNFGDMGR